jgi:hypothetical protein
MPVAVTMPAKCPGTCLLIIQSGSGFQNVIDAFHVVNQQEVPVRYFLDDRKSHGGIRITENLFSLFESVSREDLLLETAWYLNISRHRVTVGYDDQTGLIYASKANLRTVITSSRDPLNGYLLLFGSGCAGF